VGVRSFGIAARRPTLWERRLSAIRLFPKTGAAGTCFGATLGTVVRINGGVTYSLSGSIFAERTTSVGPCALVVWRLLATV